MSMSEATNSQETATKPPTRVFLVVVDETEEMRNALRYACRRAQHTQGKVALLLVITVVNGIAEELFFRGAAYAAVTRYPVVVTTIAYAVATLATGNVMLAFAAVLLGAVVGLERRASGGVLAPILTHVTWSATMLLALPLVFG